MSRFAAMPSAARLAAIFLPALLLPPCRAAAQEAPPTVEAPAAAEAQPRTGNGWIDARLRDMDDYAARYRDAFVDEIVRYQEAPRGVVEAALDEGAMRPGDVYFACALARATGRACRAVVDAWRAAPDAGWQALATQLGVEPGAGVYRRIRGDITESYVRWARPLDPARPASK